MPDYTSIAHRQSQLIRKALQGSVFVAPYSATAITSITTGSSMDIAPLPTGYVDVGMIDKKNAVTWANKVTATDVMAWGDVYPARKDITAVDGHLTFTMLETNKQSLQLSLGMDLSTTPLDNTTKELKINQPARPNLIYYRVLGLFQDGTGTNAIYVARFYPRAVVTDITDQKWDDDADCLTWTVTLSPLNDSTAGTPCTHFFAGPGWASQLSATGFNTNPGGS